MKAKKILALLLALAMVLGLAACGGSDSSSSTPASSAADQGGDDAGNADDSAADDGDSAEPAVVGDTTFRLAINRWAESWGLDFTQTAFLKEVTEQTGVSIEWDVYYNADYSEQKSLLLAGGNLPDGFFGSIALTDADVAQNKASFVDLTDLINEENMPNLTQIFKDDPQMKAISTDGTGRIYSLPTKLPKRPLTANQMFINTDFLAALNMEMPDTYEDLADFLIACGTQDPDGNGEDDTYGQSNVASLLGDMNNLLLPFGVQTSREGNYMGLDGDTVYFIPTTDKYKDAVKWANNLYVNGGLDAERFTQDSSLSTAKVQAEGGSKVGAVWQWSVDAETGGNVGQFEVCQAVKGPDGQRYVESDPTSLNYGRRQLIITTTCSDPARLLQWADCFYTDLAAMQTFWGSIGDGKISDNGDGTYSVLAPEDGSSLDTSAWVYSFRDHGPGYMYESFEDKVTLPEDQGDGVKLAANEIDLPNVHDGMIMPVCSYTDEQLSTLTLLTTDIYNYIETTYADWVVNGGIDEGWDAYVKQLDAMGLSQVIEIQQEAYNNFINS